MNNFLISSPQEYFRSTLKEAVNENSVEISQETEFYLVNLLVQFINTDYLYVTDEKGKNINEPLALLLGDAFNEQQSVNKAKMCQKVGDVSLYVSGFFGDSLQRKAVDVDYYISMGRLAYSAAKDLNSGRALTEVYEEIINKFIHIVDVFNHISGKANLTKSSNLLRQFTLWEKTKSERLTKILQENGIFPVNVSKIKN